MLATERVQRQVSWPTSRRPRHRFGSPVREVFAVRQDSCRVCHYQLRLRLIVSGRALHAGRALMLARLGPSAPCYGSVAALSTQARAQQHRFERKARFGQKTNKCDSVRLCVCATLCLCAFVRLCVSVPLSLCVSLTLCLCVSRLGCCRDLLRSALGMPCTRPCWRQKQHAETVLLANSALTGMPSDSRPAAGSGLPCAKSSRCLCEHLGFARLVFW